MPHSLVRAVSEIFAELFPSRPKAPPSCFGIYRSPQHDAEACCEDCPFDAACRNIVKPRS